MFVRRNAKAEERRCQLQAGNVPPDAGLTNITLGLQPVLQ